ncbi:Hypothetical predicted protein [Mytilus galloprovincialis]|uniref:H-type lectin domain-containing protein n=1 Tax=Mytilus galloprovincialis TaxID=29158 RepID=A0A8B6H135_MYTGA|nr:Hypothetical predicted protein [Mytilus galloprovincialis]
MYRKLNFILASLMVIGTVRGEESTGCSGEACSTDPSVDILGDSNATLISNFNISQLNEQYSSDIEEEIKQELEKERREIGRAADKLGLFKESGLNVEPGDESMQECKYNAILQNIVDLQKLYISMYEKVSSALQRISNIEQKVSKTRKICQSGHFGQQLHIPGNSFPTSAYIRFYPAFEHTPAIVYGLYLYDTSRLANSRFNTIVRNLSRYGFNITITSWADTKMFGARISWMACLKNV